MTHHNTTADVVVIGSGVVGASVAYHLASGRTFPANRPEVRERVGCKNFICVDSGKKDGLIGVSLNWNDTIE